MIQRPSGRGFSPLSGRLSDASGFRQTFVSLLLTWVAVGGLIIVVPAVTHPSNAQAYALSSSEKSLIGKVDTTLAKKITFDSKNNQYVFNADGKSSGSKPPSPAAGYVGHSDKQTANPYSVDLPVDPTKGVTFYHNNLQLSFTSVPQFELEPAQRIDGRIVYGIPGGGYVVYSVKGNGLKEDIVLVKPACEARPPVVWPRTRQFDR